MSIKELTKRVLHPSTLNMLRYIRSRLRSLKYRGLSTQETFSRIYETGAWGRSDDLSTPFCSGRGSRDNVIVSIYVNAVRDFLSKFDKKPSVVDLGCGDFYVGSQIRAWCGDYTACDIVPHLIEHNKKQYKALAVNFRQLDVIRDELPDADVAFIRQVLQHLSNNQILEVTRKLQ